MNIHGKINYVEYPSSDLVATRTFFEQAFGWEFQEFGPEYIAFADQGLDGGFYLANKKSVSESGAALIVFFSSELEETLRKIEQAGGHVVKPIFPFPGGRRFHFFEPSGNEFAVWTDVS